MPTTKEFVANEKKVQECTGHFLRSIVEYLRDRARARSNKDLLVGEKLLITEVPHESSHSAVQ